MSRIGKKSVLLPSGVTARVAGEFLIVTGPKSTLQTKLPESVTVVITEGIAEVKTTSEKTNLQGVIRAVLNNMVKGVTEGFSKTLELNGTGFRAATTGTELNLALGFSHPVKVIAPKGITFEVKDNKIKVLGADKIQVGEVASQIRSYKPADVYKHKGFKYEGEKLIKKAGKAAKAGAPTGK